MLVAAIVRTLVTQASVYRSRNRMIAGKQSYSFSVLGTLPASDDV